MLARLDVLLHDPPRQDHVRDAESLRRVWQTEPNRERGAVFTACGRRTNAASRKRAPPRPCLVSLDSPVRVHDHRPPRTARTEAVEKLLWSKLTPALLNTVHAKKVLSARLVDDQYSVFGWVQLQVVTEHAGDAAVLLNDASTAGFPPVRSNMLSNSYRFGRRQSLCPAKLAVFSAGDEDAEGVVPAVDVVLVVDAAVVALLLPREAGLVVGHRAVAIVGVAAYQTLLQLAVLPGAGAGDAVAVSVVAAGLPRLQQPRRRKRARQTRGEIGLAL